MRHHGASPHDAVVPKFHAGKNRDPRSEPAIIVDSYGRCLERRVVAICDVVILADDLYVRAEEDIGAEDDPILSLDVAAGAPGKTLENETTWFDRYFLRRDNHRREVYRPTNASVDPEHALKEKVHTVY